MFCRAFLLSLLPAQRLAFLAQHLPICRGASFGSPVGNVTFVRDLCPETWPSDRNYDTFLHCGPCGRAVYAYVVQRLRPGARVVLVGAGADGGHTGCINQRCG